MELQLLNNLTDFGLSFLVNAEDFEDSLLKNMSRESRTSFRQAVESMDKYVVPVISFVGCLGNMVSFVVFVGTYLRRTSSSIYLAFLAFADFLFLFCVLINWIKVFGLDIYVRNGWCQLFLFLTYSSNFMSVWAVVSFTCERHISVSCPLKRQALCTTKRAKIVVISLSILAVILYSFILGTAGINPVKIGPLTIIACGPLPRFRNATDILDTVDTVITLVIPFLAIFIMNIRIAYKVVSFYRQRKCVARRQFSESSTYSRHLQGEVSQRSNVIYTKTQARVTKMLLIVSTMFLVMNLPRHVIRFYQFIALKTQESYKPTEISLNCQKLFEYLYYLHFAVNLFLYTLYGKSFRKAFTWLKQRLRHQTLELRNRYGFFRKGHDPYTSTRSEFIPHDVRNGTKFIHERYL